MGKPFSRQPTRAQAIRSPVNLLRHRLTVILNVDLEMKATVSLFAESLVSCIKIYLKLFVFNCVRKYFQFVLAEISCVLNVDIQRGANWLSISWTNPREVKSDVSLGFLILFMQAQASNRCQLFWRVSKMDFKNDPRDFRKDSVPLTVQRLLKDGQ